MFHINCLLSNFSVNRKCYLLSTLIFVKRSIQTPLTPHLCCLNSCRFVTVRTKIWKPDQASERMIPRPDMTSPYNLSSHLMLARPGTVTPSWESDRESQRIWQRVTESQTESHRESDRESQRVRQKVRQRVTEIQTESVRESDRESQRVT